MTGRKIKRGLPLLDFGKADIDDELLSKKDWDAKLAAKDREDRRRGARPCQVKPGDVVIVENHVRPKGESRFSTKKYTVTEESNGDLLVR